jgi:hypothetical protein
MSSISSVHPDALSVASTSLEPSTSAVAWPAIFAGAAVSSSVSLVLVLLGAGFGLASISPWPGSGASITTFSALTAIWFIVVQWVASGVGGYLTGRLRIKWVSLHTHEVFFRDTAHGFVTWAVATTIVAGFLASALSSATGTGARASATVAAGAAQGAAASQKDSGSVGPYNLDALFRPQHPDQSEAATDAKAEAARILAKGIANDEVPTADRAYLAEMISARTGISQEDAQKRVDNAIAQAKDAELKLRAAADAARKAAAEASIFMALSMLVGAFIACTAAALGGRERDLHV